MGPKKKAKRVFLSKVRVEPSQLKRWGAAYEAYVKRSGDPDMSFAAWVRLACDTQAARDQQA